MYRIRRQPLEQQGQVAADELSLHASKPAKAAAGRSWRQAQPHCPGPCSCCRHKLWSRNALHGCHKQPHGFPLTSQLLWEQKGVGTSQRHAQPLQGWTGWLNSMYHVSCSSESCMPARLQLAERKPAGVELALHDCCRVRCSPCSSGRQQRCHAELAAAGRRSERSSAACFVKR